MAGLDFSRFPEKCRSVAAPDVTPTIARRGKAPTPREQYTIGSRPPSTAGAPCTSTSSPRGGRPQRAQPFQLTARANDRQQDRRRAADRGVGVVAAMLARRHLRMRPRRPPGRDPGGRVRVLRRAGSRSLLEADHVADLAGRDRPPHARASPGGCSSPPSVGPLRRAGAVRTPALAAHARLLDPAARRPRPRPAGGARPRWSAPRLAAWPRSFSTPSAALPARLGLMPGAPVDLHQPGPSAGTGYTVAQILENLLAAIAVGLGSILLLLLFWSILRREWLAATIFVALTSLQAAFFSDAPIWIVVPVSLALRAIPVVLALRFGVLADDRPVSWRSCCSECRSRPTSRAGRGCGGGLLRGGPRHRRLRVPHRHRAAAPSASVSPTSGYHPAPSACCWPSCSLPRPPSPSSTCTSTRTRRTTGGRGGSPTGHRPARWAADEAHIARRR